MSVTAPPPAERETDLPSYRFSVEQYYALGDCLPPEARTELIDGLIYEMPPPGPRHCALAQQLMTILRGQIPKGLQVREEKPVRLGEFSESVPDLSVVKERPGDPWFAGGHPEGSECVLVVEISDSTALHDRKVKLPAYAHAGVPEVWIIDPKAGRIERYTEPADDEFRSIRIVDVAEPLTLSADPEWVIELGALLF